MSQNITSGSRHDVCNNNPQNDVPDPKKLPNSYLQDFFPCNVIWQRSNQVWTSSSLWLQRFGPDKIKTTDTNACPSIKCAANDPQPM